MLYRVEGIVIRSMDYGEGNKIITLCTESGGKVGVLSSVVPKSPKADMLRWCSRLRTVNTYISVTRAWGH